MNFDEWYDDYDQCYDIKAMMQAAWDAARKEQRERDAALCERLAVDTDFGGDEVTAALADGMLRAAGAIRNTTD